jgi:hypothetical protein
MTTIPDYDLQVALNNRLNDEFSMMPIAWENAKYVDPDDSSIEAPVLGTPYLAAFLLPAEPDILTLGTTPYQERRGIFQVSCFYPALAGWGPVKTKAAEIVAAFPATLQFVYNGLTISIDKTWPGPGISQDGWYMCPVSIKYHCVYKG